VSSAGAPPEKYAAAIEWIKRHSLPLTAVAIPRTTRVAYYATMYDHNGQPFAPYTFRNKMKALSGVIKFAIELGLLETNPLARISTAPPRKATTVDRRVAVNPKQARALIDAVRRQGRTGPRLVAFFAVIYYAGLRPSEVLALRAQDCKLPKRGWGTLCFAEAAPYVGKAWTDDGIDNSPRKALKHRAKSQSRTVPACPELVAHLRAHIEEFGTADDGRIFANADGTPFRYGTYARIWSAARHDALTADQFKSPLAARPYDLRHAAVSTWLNAGVPATQVAEWAGHSVEMLLKTYAKCVDGQEKQSRQRIAEALGQDDQEPDDSDENERNPGDDDHA
jgi:integrase